MNIMHYDYSDKTTVPTELLQDPYLSVDTKGPVSYTHLDVYKRQPLDGYGIVCAPKGDGVKATLLFP